jgi:hypothetical protein
MKPDRSEKGFNLNSKKVSKTTALLGTVYAEQPRTDSGMNFDTPTSTVFTPVLSWAYIFRLSPLQP